MSITDMSKAERQQLSNSSPPSKRSPSCPFHGMHACKDAKQSTCQQTNQSSKSKLCKQLVKCAQQHFSFSQEKDEFNNTYVISLNWRALVQLTMAHIDLMNICDQEVQSQSASWSCSSRLKSLAFLIVCIKTLVSFSSK